MTNFANAFKVIARILQFSEHPWLRKCCKLTKNKEFCFKLDPLFFTKFYSICDIVQKNVLFMFFYQYRKKRFFCKTISAFLDLFYALTKQQTKLTTPAKIMKYSKHFRLKDMHNSVCFQINYS